MKAGIKFSSKFVMIISFVYLFAFCKRNTHVDSLENHAGNEAASSNNDSLNNRKNENSLIDQKLFELLEEKEVYFTSTSVEVGDLDIERIVLSADVMVDDKGRIGWSDSHIWKVESIFKSDTTLIYLQDIQSGFLTIKYGNKGFYLKEDGPFNQNKYYYNSDKTLVKVLKIPGNLATLKLD